MEQSLDNIPDRVEIVYKDAIDNIIFNKKQQWKITNYALLAYAALVALTKFSTSAQAELGKVLPILLITTVFVFGLYLLVMLQIAITKFRSRLAWIYRQYFSEEEIKCLSLSISEKSFLYQPAIFLGLVGVLAFGGLLCGFILSKQA